MPRSSIFPWQHKAQRDLEARLFAHVEDRAFPCVGAKAALARGTLEVLACNRIDSAWDDVRIHDRLLGFAQEYRQEQTMFRSLAVVFEGPPDLDEQDFESFLWDRLDGKSLVSGKRCWIGVDLVGGRIL